MSALAAYPSLGGPTPLGPAPRRVPPDVVAAVYAHRNVTSTLWYFIPATIAGGFAIAAPTRNPRMFLLAIMLLLLLQGFRHVIPALFAARRTVERMRTGSYTVGQVLQCHLPWDSKKAFMPYGEFLANWPANIARSQVGKAMGCFMSFVVMVFIVPFVLMALLAVGAVLWRGYAVPDFVAGPNDVDLPYALHFLGYAVTFAAIVVGFLWLFRRFTVAQVVPYGQWDRQGQAPVTAVGDAWNPEQARVDGAPLALPADSNAMELVCRVEFRHLGEMRGGEGNVRLCDRLDARGREPLIFDADNAASVTFLNGLPEHIRVDPQGRWTTDGGHAQAGLVVTAAFATAALLIFAWYVPEIAALLRPSN